jgi:hypothetical protein
VVASAASGREPKSGGPGKPSVIRLPAHSATMADCCRIQELILGAKPSGAVPLTIGMLEIISTVELSVTAVYTATDDAGSAPSISVKQIAAKPALSGWPSAARRSCSREVENLEQLRGLLLAPAGYFAGSQRSVGRNFGESGTRRPISTRKSRC